jgi:hypothetical protein
MIYYSRSSLIVENLHARYLAPTVICRIVDRNDIKLRFVLTISMAMTLLSQGCVSMETSGKDGKPKTLGFAFVRSVGGATGNIYQILAPGLSFRFVSAAPGISLGWHETRLFYPTSNTNTNGPIEPVAIQTKCDGFDFGPTYIMAGFESVFAIPFPKSSENTIQLIIYSERNPTNAIIERKEIR